MPPNGVGGGPREERLRARIRAPLRADAVAAAEAVGGRSRATQDEQRRMSMYAVVESGGKQYKVEKGTSLLVDRLIAKERATRSPCAR